MRKLFNWILSLIVASIIFVVSIILLPIKTVSVEKVELTYIFVDEDGKEYNIFEKKHGAASDWAFLFNDELENNSGEIKEWYLPNKDYIWWENNELDVKLEDKNKLEDDKEKKNEANWKKININDLKEDIENNELKDEDLEKLLEKEREKQDEWAEELSWEKIIFDDCITPWNNVIKHGESVLAYQQRKDVPTICNVQRRKCDDGELKWFYTQASCKEDIEYQYSRVAVISKNSTKLREFIQTPDWAKNNSAIFTNDGKINQSNDDVKTTWNNGTNNPVYQEDKTDLTHKKYKNCLTSRGEVVAHWQFIRAYESPLGFVDEKCKVELRLCLDWILKWNYSYKKCKYIDVTQMDYMAWNKDVIKPTPDLMIETLTDKDEWVGLFWWIGWLFD